MTIRRVYAIECDQSFLEGNLVSRCGAVFAGNVDREESMHMAEASKWQITMNAVGKQRFLCPRHRVAE